ncbi:MAG: hypothetical protein CMJ54_03200 [Planctomycetaceae bacterium]|nr:hypothetical protein [Planctomycetaceae bacterium]
MIRDPDERGPILREPINEGGRTASENPIRNGTDHASGTSGPMTETRMMPEERPRMTHLPHP